MSRLFRSKRRQAFSLVEVILAVGVLSLAVIALVGVVGPLLRGLSEDRLSGELESILAAVRQWSTLEAETGYETFRDELRTGTDRFVYRIESSTIEDGGWTVGELDSFTSEISAATVDRFVRGPVACYMELSSEAQIAYSYEPFLIDIWIGGLPDPTSDIDEWASELQTREPDYSVRYVIHR